MDPWHRYAAFLKKRYSAHTFLVVIIGLYLSVALVIGKLSELYSKRPYTHLLWSMTTVSQGLLVLGAMAMTFVWCHKTDEPKQQRRFEDRVALAQALSPVLIALGLGLHIFIEFIHGGNDIDETLLAQSGLKVFPLILFFVLRDIKFTSIAIAWGICLASLLACCVYTQSFERFSALLSYSLMTSVVFYDSHRQARDMYEVIEQLQATLAENEKLAVAAQALELRAMIGNVAHDLKTPLTSILSGIECMTEVVTTWERKLGTPSNAMLMNGFTAAAQENFRALRSCLKNMHGSNSFMTMTINRCIDYTKASKGVKLVPKMVTAALLESVSMPVELMRTVQSAVAVRLHAVGAAICTHVITDQQWLIENLLCLLSNAVKYSHKGTVEVSVSLEGAASEPQFLRFEVQDTGVGLSEEAMQTLFNPFKQAQRLAGGTGLGLFSLAKRVEALQGQYGVRKRQDGCQGSVFWFSIPYRPDPLSAKMAHLPLSSAASTASSDSSSDVTPFTSPRFLDVSTVQSALVVDDAPLIVKMTSMLLSRKGHTVESAVNGADALEKLLQSYEAARSGEASSASAQVEVRPRYDVVLMDLQMPVLDGIETIRRLRAAELGWEGAASHQLVIALSANSDEETRLAALEAGADAFMAKPFTYESFVRALQCLSEGAASTAPGLAANNMMYADR